MRPTARFTRPKTHTNTATITKCFHSNSSANKQPEITKPAVPKITLDAPSTSALWSGSCVGPTRTHDYIRHGTLTLFAALNYLDGKIISRTAQKHTHRQWLGFLKQIEAETPSGLCLHLIVDNSATHKHPRVRAWLARHPRIHVHFTPTSSSWMNLVERFFRDLTEDVVRQGSFVSTRQLSDAIVTYLTDRNLTPKRYVWRKSGQEILASIQRAQQALAREQATK